MATTATNHSHVLFTWHEDGDRVEAEGFVPDIIARKAEHRPQCLLQELTHDERLGIDLSEVEPVEAVVDLGLAEFKIRMETDEDGEPAARHVGTPRMN